MPLDKKDLQAIGKLIESSLARFEKTFAKTLRQEVADVINDQVVPQLDGIYRQLELFGTRLDNLESSVGDLRTNQLQLINVLRDGKVITRKQAESLQSRLLGSRAA